MIGIYQVLKDKYYINTEEDLWEFAYIVNSGENFKDKIAGTLHTFGNDLTFKDFLIYWFDNIF